MTEYFIPELSALDSSSAVTITGVVVGTRRFTDRHSLHIKDPFGTVIVEVRRDADVASSGIPARKGDRVRVDGLLFWLPEGKPVIRTDSPLEVLGNATARLEDLSSAMREQASRILLAHATRLLAEALRAEGFLEFDSRAISTRWTDRGLEPLHIHYPGFGGTVALATSPSAQVTDLINTTGTTKAFTVATSFSTTYRFPEAGAELRVVVGKAVDYGLDKLGEMIDVVLHRVLRDIRSGWSGSENEQPVPSASQVIEAQVGREDDSQLVVKATSPKGILLAEGATESVGEDRNLGGFTFYPSNLLTMLSATPTRNLKDLRAFNVW